MKTFKKIFLFVAINIAIILLINIIIRALNYFFWIQLLSNPWDLTGLIIFSVIFWFAGSFISLLISKWTVKRLYKIQFITAPNSPNAKLNVVYSLVHELAMKNDIKMPEVWFYHSDEPNAFATWPSKNNSLVAVSSALLDQMTEDEIRGVVAHEMSHILNWDMVMMTLLQWVINTFVIFLARVIAFAIDRAMKSDDDNGLWHLWYFIVVNILDVLLWFAGMIVLMWYSRHREYRADEWSSVFVWKQSMIAALEKLKIITKNIHTKNDEIASLKIAWWRNRLHLFSTHPSLDDRINKLKTIN